MSIMIKVSKGTMNKMDWENNQSEVVVFCLLGANYEIFKQVGMYQDNQMKVGLERVFDNFDIETDKKAKIDYLDGLAGLVDKGIISIADDIAQIKFTTKFIINDTTVFEPTDKFAMMKVEDLVEMMKAKRPYAKNNVTVYLNTVSRTNNKLFHMSYDDLTYQYTNREHNGEDGMLIEMTGEETAQLEKVCTWTNVDKMCCSRSQEDQEVHEWIDRRTFLSTVERLAELNLLKSMQTQHGTFKNSLVFYKPEHKELIVQLYNRNNEQTDYAQDNNLKKREKKQTKAKPMAKAELENKPATSPNSQRRRFDKRR